MHNHDFCLFLFQKSKQELQGPFLSNNCSLQASTTAPARYPGSLPEKEPQLPSRRLTRAANGPAAGDQAADGRSRLRGRVCPAGPVPPGPPPACSQAHTLPAHKHRAMVFFTRGLVSAASSLS